MVKIMIPSFVWRIWKWKEKRDKFFLTFQSGASNPKFSVIIQSTIWVFMEGESDEIKSGGGS